MAKRGMAALFLAALLAVSPLLLAAAPAGDGKSPLESASAWLTEKTPSPQPGDEALLFTLLRAEVWRPEDAPVQEYIRETLVLLEDGGAARQALAQGAMQAVALSAAGIEIDVVVPSLLQALCDAEALGAEGYAAQLPTLALFGSLGAEVPGGILFSPLGLARTVAATQNDDGGFGADGSSAYTTAAVMLALAGFMENGDISTSLIEAQLWLQENTNSHGGFNDAEGAEDAYATALAMLALDAMGYNPEYLSYNTGSMLEYLVTFQNLDGSFAPVGSDAQDYELTVLAAAAMAACARFGQGRSAFFSLEDVVPQDPTDLMPQVVSAPKSGSGWAAALVAGGIVLVLALVALIILRIRRRGR